MPWRGYLQRNLAFENFISKLLLICINMPELSRYSSGLKVMEIFTNWAQLFKAIDVVS